MEHKKAAEILISLLDKHPLSEEERGAVLAAVGVLAWTSLSQSRIKGLKAKRNREVTRLHVPGESSTKLS